VFHQQNGRKFRSKPVNGFERLRCETLHRDPVGDVEHSDGIDDKRGKRVSIGVPGSDVIGEVLDLKVESYGVRSNSDDCIQARFCCGDARRMGEFGVRK
jgi:hypothetical protein